MELTDLRDLLQLLRQHRVTHYRSGGLELKLDLKDNAATETSQESKVAPTFRGVNPNYNHPSLGLAGRIKLDADNQ